MSNKLNDILEEFDSLTLEEQEAVLDIERKRLIQRKREILIEDINEAEAEFKNGVLKPESIEDIMKAIDETDSNE